MNRKVVLNLIISLLSTVASVIFRQMVKDDMIFTVLSGVILFAILMAFTIFGNKQ